MTDLSKFKVAKAFKDLPITTLGEGLASSFTSIRYRGKAWTLQHGGKNYPFLRQDDGTPLSYIDVIILGENPHTSKVYFGNSGAWNEDSASAPICASLKGDVPDPGVPIPQSKTCALCSHDEWITKPGGGRGKECQDHKRMAVLLMPSMTAKMFSTPLVEPVFLKIPPGSFRTFKTFGNDLAAAGIPFESVVTRISFSQERQFEMNFEVIQALKDAEAKAVLPLRTDRQTKTILGGMPEMREIPPPLPKEEEQEDTGLLAAFGGKSDDGKSDDVEVRPRGRPAGVKNKPKMAIEHDPTETVTAKPAETQDETPWEESDTDIDNTLAKLMGNKMNNMLK